MIELRHLRYFAAVARHQHFTRAAKDLGIAQPALSNQIRQLEARLGAMLFERSKRRIRLTEAGTVLLARAEQVLKILADTEREMQAFAGITRGHVTIGALPLLGELHFPALLAGFNRQFPGVEVLLREDSNDRLIELLKSGEIELALLDLALIDRRRLEGLAIEDLYSTPSVLLMAPGHRLAGRSKVSVGDLDNERLITFTHGSAARYRRFGEACELAGISPAIAVQSSQMSLVRTLVASGHGLAVGPSWATEIEGPPVAAAELDIPGFQFDVALAWRADRRSPAVLSFLAFAQNHFRSAVATPASTKVTRRTSSTPRRRSRRPARTKT